MQDGDESGSGLSRRDMLKIGAAALAVAACGDDGAPGLVDDVDGSVPSRPDAQPRPDAAGAVDAGDAVDAAHVDAGQPDAEPPPDAGHVWTPEELLAPIDTFVVLCMENRSYDHMLGARKLLEGKPGNGLTADMKNVSPEGLDIYVHRLNTFTPNDPPHDWAPVHAQWNGGAMDGFVKAHAGGAQADVMGYHVREDVPVSWALADEFVDCDRWFCSVLGPTWPNRLYLHGASSNGNQGNSPAFGFSSVFNQMGAAGFTATNYFSDIAWAVGGYLKFGGNAGIEKFFTDAQNGTLPNFALIDPGFFGAGANDDHPDHDVRLGQALISSIYAALAASPQWKRCLFVITYDEHGGFFDHVAPPVVPDEREAFRQLGMRVPGLVAGPFVPQGKVVSTTFEHVSVISTLQKRFGLPFLNERAEKTADLSSCIDPALFAAPRSAPGLPEAPPVSLAALEALDRRLRGVRPTHHTELWNFAERARLPAHLDRRARSLDIARKWLGAGERLGAVRLIR